MYNSNISAALSADFYKDHTLFCYKLSYIASKNNEYYMRFLTLTATHRLEWE